MSAEEKKIYKEIIKIEIKEEDINTKKFKVYKFFWNGAKVVTVIFATILAIGVCDFGNIRESEVNHLFSQGSIVATFGAALLALGDILEKNKYEKMIKNIKLLNTKIEKCNRFAETIEFIPKWAKIKLHNKNSLIITSKIKKIQFDVGAHNKWISIPLGLNDVFAFYDIEFNYAQMLHRKKDFIDNINKSTTKEERNGEIIQPINYQNWEEYYPYFCVLEILWSAIVVKISNIIKRFGATLIICATIILVITMANAVLMNFNVFSKIVIADDNVKTTVEDNQQMINPKDSVNLDKKNEKDKDNNDKKSTLISNNEDSVQYTGINEVNKKMDFLYKILHNKKKVPNKQCLESNERKEFDRLTQLANTKEDKLENISNNDEEINTILDIIKIRKDALEIFETQEVYKLLANSYDKLGILKEGQDKNEEKKFVRNNDLEVLTCYSEAIEYLKAAIEIEGEYNPKEIVKEMAIKYYNIAQLQTDQDIKKEAYKNAIAAYEVYIKESEIKYEDYFYISNCYYEISKLLNNSECINCVLKAEENIKKASKIEYLNRTSEYNVHTLLQKIYNDLEINEKRNNRMSSAEEYKNLKEEEKIKAEYYKPMI
ncbi:hypothetical protein [Crassaminicella profunda]|uniref:hypothetical protein n=1 Tax=Crassaminicella profunda TaxID=1286698 RepID=UPI001CA6FF27|nr:hypothetical protein [Crassaminicella profunda]QZY54972.1 hypothetical protein K7H06_18450 [Crassaminicella profunda]